MRSSYVITRHWILAGLFGLLLLVRCAHPEAHEARPNIVLIMCDDMGYSDVGCFGGEIRTPNLDRLASEGLRFTQYYNNAKCVESRASLLTGLYYHQTDNLKLANHVTLADVMRSAGYSTYMVGKWHLPDLPVDHGFDRWFGFTGGDANFFTGATRDGEPQMWLDDARYSPPDSGFYTTDAFTDYAIRFLDRESQQGRPFFLYAAYNAPHFPLHAHPQDIEKYRGKYLKGWDQLRNERLRRMYQIGVLNETSELTARDPIVPEWDSLDESQRKAEDLLMAVYAAMVDCLDQNIGRLLTHLKEIDADQNTIVLFLSDNGGCPYDFNETPDVAPGPADSCRSYNTPWANLSNTPFRLYKQYSHEGGISTPLIVRWPAKIKTGNRLTDQIGHIIDIFPTLTEVAEAEYPPKSTDRQVLPLEGISLVPAFHGKSTRTNEPIFWEFLGNRAVRSGKWKLVAERSKVWELYDMRTDRSELKDLSEQHPTRAARMAATYDAWAKRTGARSHEVALKMEPSTQGR